MITRNSVYDHSAGNSRNSGGIREICRVLFKHKRKMAVVFCTTLALVIVGLAVYPRSYTSEARLLVRLGKESVGLDPTASLGQTISVEQTRENEIYSEMEILSSRVLFEDVVNRLGADTILQTSPDDGSGLVGTLLAPLRTVKSWLSGNVSPLERAVHVLQKSVDVTSPRRTNVIMVKYSASDPELAQQILQAYLDSYLVRHVKANRTSGSHDFFVEQSDLVREQLTLANEELRNAKNKNGLTSIEGERGSIQAQSDAIEMAMLDNERKLSASEAKIAALKKTLGELPDLLVAEESDLADVMRNELYKVQILEKEASSRYTALHPKVIALRRQVDETRKIYSEDHQEGAHKTRRTNPVYQHVQTELAGVQAEAAAELAQAESLKKQFEAVQNRIRTLNDNELRITELTRKTELLEASYRNYSVYREQARIDQALELGRISNVNMVQPASFVAKASTPSVRLTLLLGLFAASVVSLAVPFLVEHFDRSLKTPEQTEQQLGLPVLFTVPRAVRQELLSK